LRLEVDAVSWSLFLPRLPPDLMRRSAALTAEVEHGSLPDLTLRAELVLLEAVTGMRPADEATAVVLDVLQDGRLLANAAFELGFYWALGALAMCERLDECGEWVRRRWELASRAGSRAELHALATHRAVSAQLRGELAEAIDEARYALEDQAATRFRYLVPWPATELVAALVERGELDEAEAVLDAHGLADGLSWMWYELIPVRVALALARGDLGRARAQLAAAPPERALLPLYMAPCEVELALADGQRERALERAQAMLMVAESFGAPGKLGVAQRLMGLATGSDDGIELLRSAVETLDRSPRRLELARALVDLGASLRRCGQRTEAREPLRRGLDIAQRRGAKILADRAMEELRATGARPRRLVLTGVESLTPSELRVARLAAEGRSNREIAQALFVTGATVETHMAHVFQKLDLRSRDQLSVALAG
jgi:DNA-binding CsgD family transcriptional regulator